MTNPWKFFRELQDTIERSRTSLAIAHEARNIATLTRKHTHARRFYVPHKGEIS